MASTHDTGTKVRSLYFYIASLVTLGLVIGSLVAVLALGLQSWVFTNADPVGYRIGPPPEPYIPSLISDKTGELTTASCDESCAFSTEDQQALTQWQQQYAEWHERMENPNTQRYERLITALSLLIIALPLFFIHFRIVQREGREGAPLPSIRSSYFYLVSLAALLMVVIAGSIFINSMLRLWLIPQSSNTVERVVDLVSPVSPKSMGTTTVEAIKSCGDVCELDPAIVSAAGTWQDDYDQWQDSQQKFDSLQNQASSSLPFILLGIPLFWYHWRYAREKKRADTPSETPSNQ